MKKLLLISLMMTSLSVSAITEKFSYELATEVRAKRMGEYVVRYLRTLDSSCMGFLQSLTSDKNDHWSIYQTKTLCEMDGKSTITGFADATITKLEFEENSIQMVIRTIPLGIGSALSRNCTIKINNGKFSPLHCDKPEFIRDLSSH